MLFIDGWTLAFHLRFNQDIRLPPHQLQKLSLERSYLDLLRFLYLDIIQAIHAASIGPVNWIMTQMCDKGTLN